jgi:hypothetical protein
MIIQYIILGSYYCIGMIYFIIKDYTNATDSLKNTYNSLSLNNANENDTKLYEHLIDDN